VHKVLSARPHHIGEAVPLHEPGSTGGAGAKKHFLRPLAFVLVELQALRAIVIMSMVVREGGKAQRQEHRGENRACGAGQHGG
ncbi:MAG: hypothetical protein KA941_08105, partial [Flavobacteriales bacterium]|nr:hypothetical protein [Flavobacteriales bacterium]